MLLLKQDIKKKKQVNSNLLSKPKRDFKEGNNKKYKNEVIVNNVIYNHKTENQLPSFY